MSASITSITGLQNLVNLQRFVADWNSLTSVNLSNLTELTWVDISDCEILGTEGQHSLTSVNLTGCIALEELRLDDSTLSVVTSTGFPNFAGLPNLKRFDFDGCNITGDIDLSQASSTLLGIDLNDNFGITSVQLPEAYLDSVNLHDTALTETAVNNILQWLDGSGVENGSVDLAGGTSSPPSGNGITAADSLISKGWNVFVNEPVPGSVGIAASTDFDIVGNFTIEMFVNMSNTTGNPRPYSFGVYPAANAMSIENGTLYFWANNTPLVSGLFEPNIGEWNHICVVGSGETVNMFVNGFNVGSSPYSGSISSQGFPLTIGFGNEPNSAFNGLISNFRWTGSAVYDTGGFTVPTEPLSDLSQTKLLIFQGTNLPMQLTDFSGNNNNATNVGAAYSTNDPFNGEAGSLQMGIF